jgi:hypothetical protein
MGFLMPTPSSPPVQQYEPPKEDPALKQARMDAETRANDVASRTADASQQQSMGRLMGTRGAQSLFTSTAGGYGRTLGGANV